MITSHIKQHGKRWRAEVRLNGQRIEKDWFDSEEDAERWVDQKRQELERGK